MVDSGCTWATCVTLGAGGRHPRVDALTCGLTAIARTRELPRGASAYVLARSPDGKKLVVGTKAGQVVCLGNGGMGGDGIEELLDIPHRCAPILDAVFAGEEAVVVANADGGCWLYEIREGTVASSPLDTHEHTICALQVCGDQALIGLATDGKLISWDLETLDIVAAAEGAAPPPCSALVKLFPLGKGESLMFPGHRGDIALVDTDTLAVETVPAHDGAWYAALRVGAGVLTFGMTDGAVLRWPLEGAPPVRMEGAPEGVISAASLDEGGGRVLLVTRDGHAAVHVIAGDGVGREYVLPGDDYRVCMSPDPHAVKRREKAERMAAARSASDNALVTLHEGGDAGADLRELESLGFRHAALALRAEEAERNSDLPSALQYLAALEALLPVGVLACRRTMLRYVELLEAAWLFEEALRLRGKWDIFGDKATERLLGELARAAADESSICSCADEIPALCSCASAVGAARIGRWRIKELRPRVCPGMRLTVEGFAEKHNAICHEEGNASPEAVPLEAAYVSRDGILRAPSVMLREGDEARFEVCLRFARGENGDVVTPVVTFCFKQLENGETPHEHNQAAARTYSVGRDDEHVKARIKGVVAATTHTLRRMITKARAASHTLRR